MTTSIKCCIVLHRHEFISSPTRVRQQYLAWSGNSICITAYIQPLHPSNMLLLQGVHPALHSLSIRLHFLSYAQSWHGWLECPERGKATGFLCIPSISLQENWHWKDNEGRIRASRRDFFTIVNKNQEDFSLKELELNLSLCNSSPYVLFYPYLFIYLILST